MPDLMPNCPVNSAVCDGWVGMSVAYVWREERALPGDAVEVGGQPPVVAETAEMVGPEGVEGADEDVHAAASSLDDAMSAA